MWITSFALVYFHLQSIPGVRLGTNPELKTKLVRLLGHILLGEMAALKGDHGLIHTDMLFGFVQNSTSGVEEVNDRSDFGHRVITLFSIGRHIGIICNVEVSTQVAVPVS